MRSRSRGRRQPVSEDHAELIGLSGWLYSDLLLGLAVVFLAAVSFTVVSDLLPDDREVQPPEGNGFEEGEEAPHNGMEVRECLAGMSQQEIEIVIPPNVAADDMASVASELIRQAWASQPLDQFEDVDPDSLTFGLMLSFGLFPLEERGRAAPTAVDVNATLKEVLPARFGQAVERAYWSTPEAGRPRGSVKIELFPWVIEPCEDE